MDGVAYQIDVAARSMGTAATASEVLALANAIDAAAAVTTPFDAAISAAKANLAQASAAAADAAAGLSQAESKFAALEREATRAGKAVERAAKKGGDTSALQAQANAAAQAVSAQAAAVDKARASANAAAGAERQLAAALKSLEGQAKQTAAAEKAQATAAKNAGAGLADFGATAKGAIPILGPYVERITNLRRGLGATGVAGAAILAAIAVVGLAYAFGRAAAGAIRMALAGDKVAKQRLDKIAKLAKDNFASLFTGIDTKPLLNAFEKMANLFSTNTAAGHALQTLISTVMNPLIRAIEWITPYAKEMWNGMVYGALKVAIMVVSARNAILRLIPAEVKSAIRDLIAKFDAMGISFSIGKTVIYALAVIFGTLAGAVLIVVGIVAAMVYALGAFISACIDVGSAIWDMGGAIADAVGAAWDAVTEWASGAYQAASDFVQGLIDGITDGVGAVGEAASNLAQSALDAVTNLLGISSPSRVMMRMGGYTTQGLAEGLDAGAEDVKASMEHVVGLADIDENDQPANHQGGAPTTTTTTTTQAPVINLTVNASGGADGPSIAAEVERVLVGLFDGDALQLGGGEVAA